MSIQLEVSEYHEGLIKSLDFQVHQVLQYLTKVTNRMTSGGVMAPAQYVPGFSHQHSFNRLASSNSRYSKRSKTPSGNLMYKEMRFGHVGGTGSTV